MNPVEQLKHYLKSLADEEARKAFAARCGTSLGHMRNMTYGLRSCDPALAVSIEKETSGAVRRQDLRPEDWRAIWPEIAEAA